jgi:hypothetical protein
MTVPWWVAVLGFFAGGLIGLLVGGLSVAARSGDEQLEDEWRRRMGGERDFAERREGADGDGSND